MAAGSGVIGKKRAGPEPRSPVGLAFDHLSLDFEMD